MNHVTTKKINYAMLIFLMCFGFYYNIKQNRYPINANENNISAIVSTVISTETLKTIPPNTKDMIITFSEMQEVVEIKGFIEPKMVNKQYIQSDNPILVIREINVPVQKITETSNQELHSNASTVYTNSKSMSGSFNTPGNTKTGDLNIVLGYFMFIIGAALIFLKFITINKIKKEEL